jgi:PAS domain S-box-containing protein
MKLKYKINLVSLGILIAVAIAIAGVGIMAINQVVYDLNQKLMAKEVENMIGTVQAAHQVLKDAGVASVESYVRKAQDDLIDEFRKYKFGSTGRLIIADTVDMRLLNNPFDDKDAVAPEFLAQIKGQGIGSLKHSLGGSKRFFCFAEYPDWHWLIVLSVTTDEMLQVRTRFLASAGAILLPGLILGSLLFLWFTSKIVTPIRQLADAAASVSRGEWDVPLPDPQTDDEVAQLATAFREMSVKLALMYQNLRDNLEKNERSQEALAAEKERLAVTLRSIGDGVITTDVNGEIVLINKVAEALTGWTQEAGMGQPLQEVFRIIDQNAPESCENPVEEVIRKGEVISLPKEAVFISRDGKERIVAYSGAPILDKDGKILGVILVFRDITERKRDEDEKAKLEAKLVQAQKMEAIGTLAGGIAHDFNNILAAVVGNISLARLDQHGESSQKILVEAEKACLRAQMLARQLLTFAKGGAPIKELISMSKLITESTSFASSGSNVKCEFNFPNDLWTVEADPGQIAQVFQNLVINAIQAMPHGGTIMIRGENLLVEANSNLPLVAGQYVKISLKDQGLGITEEYLLKIFDPYFTTKKTGSGLGLATAYSIVKNHQGHIEVESRLEQGTIFIIYLPATAKEVSEPHKDDRKILKGQGRILVMDDDVGVRDMLKNLLQRLDYEVVCAEDGEEAIKLYQEDLNRKKTFSAVILDLTVPGGMGGKETIKNLLKIDPQVKAIVSSGYSEDPIMAEFTRYGFVGVISKPYRVSEMSNLLNKVICYGN